MIYNQFVLHQLLDCQHEGGHQEHCGEHVWCNYGDYYSLWTKFYSQGKGQGSNVNIVFMGSYMSCHLIYTLNLVYTNLFGFDCETKKCSLM